MKKSLPAALCAALLLATATGVSADEKAPPPGHLPPSAQGAQPPFDGPAFGDSAFDVINDLEQLKRLYELSGRPDDIVPVYHEVLEKTHNPAIRRYAYDSLAREQLKPADPAQAISTLRASLEEDLARADRAPGKDGGQGRQPAR
ncbi:hypothetical protein [Paraburkholderia tropica]|uniref:hypothetical protein n=1 Tax=Paraburkholderia tropica TaxID=92647 RepID=UPI002AB641EC|nr:hypothetical protein [Paraburkholderia tropica]